jgi:putative phosphoribosyl transferase
MRPHDMEGSVIAPPDPAGVVLLANSVEARGPETGLVGLARLAAGPALALARFDLLGEERGRDRLLAPTAFEANLVAARLVAATDALRMDPGLSDLPIGYLAIGRSAWGAAVAAAQRSEVIGAIVLATSALSFAVDALSVVTAPTLVLAPAGAAGSDAAETAACLRPRCELRVLPDWRTAALGDGLHRARVADLARRWFEQHLIVPLPAGAA